MATLCLFGLFSLPVQAVVINVGGVDYDVVFFANAYDTLHPSFNDNVGTLTDPASAPWWGVAPDGLGGAMDAQDFATAYEAAVPGSPDVSSISDSILFAYEENAGLVELYQALETGGVGTATRSVTIVSTAHVYAYTVPIVAAVPEIDGNALAKALFILFALGAWLHARRARAA
ncbi:MAG: hypothetical protein ACE368_24395 [Paracoccaceae bacterium]